LSLILTAATSFLATKSHLFWQSQHWFQWQQEKPLELEDPPTHLLYLQTQIHNTVSNQVLLYVQLKVSIPIHKPHIKHSPKFFLWHPHRSQQPKPFHNKNTHKESDWVLHRQRRQHSVQDRVCCVRYVVLRLWSVLHKPTISPSSFLCLHTTTFIL
jgi:hypothetical protein